MAGRTNRSYLIAQHVKGEVSPLKSKLIKLLSELEAAGAMREARGLSACIAKLEEWQNR